MSNNIKSFLIDGVWVDTIERLNFVAGNTPFLITETIITGDQLPNAIHVIKNLKSGKKKTLSHFKLLSILKSHKQ